LTYVDLPIGTKRTLRQDAKSNVTQDDEQDNAALTRRNHKKHKKNLIYVCETHFIILKEKEKKDVERLF